jgi:UDP-3-O-acyl N-acetylglucosamine deacetylase
LRLVPAPPGTGVVFVRTDLRSAPPIPAIVEQVTDTQRRTTLGRAPNQVGMVEHVLAALAGMRIDNCIVQLNAPEPPGLDGSARRYAEMLEHAGTVLQGARRATWTVDFPIRLRCLGATLTIYPDDEELRISYLLDYGLDAPINRQMHTHVISPAGFLNGLAACRTFILESEALEFQRQGWGRRTTAADLLVFGKRGPINNRLRFADEPARHKILDLMGDLSLFGFDLRGQVVAYRSGHPLNVQLTRELRRQLGAGCCAPRLAA